MTTPPATPLTQSTECPRCGMPCVNLINNCGCKPSEIFGNIATRLTAIEALKGRYDAAMTEYDDRLTAAESAIAALQGAVEKVTNDFLWKHPEAAKEPPAKAKITRVGRVYIDPEHPETWNAEGWEFDGKPQYPAKSWFPLEVGQLFHGHPYNDLAILCIRENPREGDRFRYQGLSREQHERLICIVSGQLVVCSNEGRKIHSGTLSDYFAQNTQHVIDPRPVPPSQAVAEHPRVQLTCGKCNRIVDELVGEIGRTQVCRSCMNNPQPKQQDQATGTTKYDWTREAGAKQFFCSICKRYFYSVRETTVCRNCHRDTITSPDQPGAAEVSSVSTGDCVRPSAETATVLTEEEERDCGRMGLVCPGDYGKRIIAIIDRLSRVPVSTIAHEILTKLQAERDALKTQLAEATTHIDLLKSSLKHSEELYEGATNEGVDRLLKIKNLESQLAQRDKELAEAKAENAQKELAIADRHELWKRVEKAESTLAATDRKLELVTQQLTAEKQAAGEAKKAYELAQAEANVEIERLTTLNECHVQAERMHQDQSQALLDAMRQLATAQAEVTRLRSGTRSQAVTHPSWVEAERIINHVGTMLTNSDRQLVADGSVCMWHQFSPEQQAEMLNALGDVKYLPKPTAIPALPPDAPQARAMGVKAKRLLDMLSEHRMHTAGHLCQQFNIPLETGEFGADKITWLWDSAMLSQSLAALAEAGFAVGEVGKP